MKVGCAAWRFGWDSPYEEAIESVGRLRFDGIELIATRETDLIEYYTQERIGKLVELCDSYGLTVSEFALAGDWWCAGGLSSFSDETKRRAKEQFERGVQISKELGTKIICFVSHWPVRIQTPIPYPPSYLYLLRDIRIKTEKGESPSLCPRNLLTKKHVSEVVSRVARELRPGFILVGLTVSIPPQSCIAGHEHVYESMGEGYNECIKAIVASVKEANPATMIESCDTTNLNNKRFWPMTHDSVGGEVGLDFSLHQRQMVLTRSFSRGTAVKNTPLPWHMEAPDEEFSKQMMQHIILGVPSLVVDLKKLSESHARILRAWLDFYRENRKELASGEF